LVLISVNEGYADQVMQTAKRAGATGGTIIRARMAGAEQLDQIMDTVVSEEKEIIAIFSPENVSAKIMEDVNEEFGLRTKAAGTVCAVPVEKAFKV
jgi:ABC-type Zn uptake system ZnuABC Zn-binding protein ZnuA